MKTTIDIAEDLLERGKRVARKRHVTLRALVEEGLRYVLSDKEPDKPFHWPPVTFKGKGLSTEFSDSDWSGIKKAIYEGRGE